MLERLIEHGRHVEIQVFADAPRKAVRLGSATALGTGSRKVVEGPLTRGHAEKLRERMGADAATAGRGLRGAGTVEFIVDAGANPSSSR